MKKASLFLFLLLAYSPLHSYYGVIASIAAAAGAGYYAKTNNDKTARKLYELKARMMINEAHIDAQGKNIEHLNQGYIALNTRMDESEALIKEFSAKQQAKHNNTEELSSSKLVAFPNPAKDHGPASPTKSITPQNPPALPERPTLPKRPEFSEALKGQIQGDIQLKKVNAQQPAHPEEGAPSLENILKKGLNKKFASTRPESVEAIENSDRPDYDPDYENWN